MTFLDEVANKLALDRSQGFEIVVHLSAREGKLLQRFANAHEITQNEAARKVLETALMATQSSESSQTEKKKPRKTKGAKKNVQKVSGREKVMERVRKVESIMRDNPLHSLDRVMSDVGTSTSTMKKYSTIYFGSTELRALRAAARGGVVASPKSSKNMTPEDARVEPPVNAPALIDEANKAVVEDMSSVIRIPDNSDAESVSTSDVSPHSKASAVPVDASDADWFAENGDETMSVEM